MNVFSVSLFGHRHLDLPVELERRLEGVVRDLLRTKEYVEFLVGRDGDFDLLAASVIRRCKREYRNDNSALVWVLPYLIADFRNNEEAYRGYYDEIEVFSGTHFKAAFLQRNKSMIDRSDLAVFAVNTNKGGAYATMKYALEQGVNLINLYDRGEG